MFNKLFENVVDEIANPTYEAIDIADPFHTFFVSDTHINHNKDFLYKPRGFENIADHDKALVERWNSVVAPGNVVFHLGDLYMGKDDEYAMNIVHQLNGAMVLINGNHDTVNKVQTYMSNGILVAGYQLMLKCGKWRFCLHHEPIMGKNFQPEGRKFYLTGHTHSQDRFQNIEQSNYCCCLDAHNMFPISLAEIMGDLTAYKTAPDNEINAIKTKMHYLDELRKEKG